MEKRIKPNWKDTLAKVGVQLGFRCSMVVHYCKTLGGIMSHKAWYKLFLARLMGIGWFAAIYSASLEKHQFGAKPTKMATSPHTVAV